MDKRHMFFLQLFADDDGAEVAEGAEGGAPGGDPDPAGKEGQDGGTEKKPDDNGEKKYSDADVDKIVSKKFAKWKAESEQAVKDAKDEAEKLAKMNAEQKQQYTMEKLQQENEQLKAQAVRVELGKTATELLREHKITATEDMLDFVVGTDADSTKANIDKFVEIINAQLKAAEVERATGDTPKRYQGGGEALTEIQKRIAKYKR